MTCYTTLRLSANATRTVVLSGFFRVEMTGNDGVRDGDPFEELLDELPWKTVDKLYLTTERQGDVYTRLS